MIYLAHPLVAWLVGAVALVLLLAATWWPA
jgi:hypothetical protein